MARAPADYPPHAADRDRWILARRPARSGEVDPSQPGEAFIEPERDDQGRLALVTTVLLTNRECPWRCLMCDLWKGTLTRPTPPGTIPLQIQAALDRLAAAPDPHRLAFRAAPPQLKLYNRGSFFDAGAIPPAEYPAIADLARGFSRVIVESHPALVGARTWQFQRLLAAAGATLEVAIGLETAHPAVLERLNKRMSLDQFRAAADALRNHRVALRAFVLVKPPFLDEPEALHWACRSIEFAFNCGAGVVSLIPTRGGNGALEDLQRQGQFAPPHLATLEAAAAFGVALRRGRVFADLWDFDRVAACPACRSARRSRIETMNRLQEIPALPACPVCGQVPPATA